MEPPRHRRATAAARALLPWAAPTAVALVVVIVMMAARRGSWDLGWELPSPDLNRGLLLDELLLLPFSAAAAGIGLSILTAVVAALLAVDRRPWGAALVVLSVSAGRMIALLVKAAFEAPRPDLGAVDSIRYPALSLPILAAAVGVLLVALALAPVRRGAAVALVALVGLVAADDLASGLITVRSGFDSFPSGHAVGSAALVASILLVTWRSPRRRFATIVLGGVFVVGAGLSRLYLREHYPADVLAGWALAVLSVAATAGVVYAVRLAVERRTAETGAPKAPKV